MQRFIVPVDGSPTSWRAVDVAAALARRLHARVHVVEMVSSPDDVAAAEHRVDQRLANVDPEIECVCEIRLCTETVAAGIEDLVTSRPGSTVVMDPKFAAHLDGDLTDSAYPARQHTTSACCRGIESSSKSSTTHTRPRQFHASPHSSVHR